MDLAENIPSAETLLYDFRMGEDRRGLGWPAPSGSDVSSRGPMLAVASGMFKPNEDAVFVGLLTRIGYISAAGWAGEDGQVPRWLQQATLTVRNAIGLGDPVQFVAGRPFVKCRDSELQNGVLYIFTSELLIRVDITDDQDSGKTNTSLQFIARRSLQSLRTDESQRHFDAVQVGMWTSGQRAILTYEGLKDPVMLPVGGQGPRISARHERDLLAFLPSLVADLGR